MVPCLGLTQTPSLTLCIYVQYVFLYGCVCVCARICKMHFIIHFVLPSFVFYSRRRVCEYLNVCVIRVFVYLVACRLSCYCLKCVHVSLLCMGVCVDVKIFNHFLLQDLFASVDRGIPTIRCRFLDHQYICALLIFIY